MQDFLLWLGEDQASGERKYEEIRKKLILLFRYRGCHVPEELADETIDRTARAVQKPDFQYRGEPAAYLRGVARNVYREWLRKERRLRTEPIPEGNLEPAAPANFGNGKDELLQSCLERCLTTLPSTKKTLLLRYYQSDKREKIDGRGLIAKELGIGLSALRLQVFRLRNALRQCVEKCRTKGEILLPKQA
jgi:DNA-directed RNA polymerase specialized sigma24 family protein